MITIHTFGDSHSSKIHSHWGYINLPNVNIICNHIGPKLMYTFGRLGLNLLNIKKYGVKEKDIVIYCFGEIDCRCHVHKHVNEEKNYKDIIDNLVNDYFVSINENKKLYNNIKICVYNVVPPVREFYVPNNPFPFIGSDEERKLYYNYMNSKIKELCEINNFIYFDIYKQSCDENGFLRKDFTDPCGMHLRHTEHSINFIKENLL